MPIEIKHNKVKLTGVHGTSWRPGNRYFDYVDEGGTSVLLDMRILRFALSVIAREEKASSIDDLLDKQGLWNDNGEKWHSLPEIYEKSRQYKGLARRTRWGEEREGLDFQCYSMEFWKSQITLEDALAWDWYLTND